MAMPQSRFIAKEKQLSKKQSAFPCFILVLLIIANFTGCASKYGYDFYDRPNWAHRHALFVGEYINARIGKHFDPTWCHPENCTKEILTGGIVLYRFSNSPYPGCTYWYEVDAITQVVVRANYRGTDQQCYKLLN